VPWLANINRPTSPKRIPSVLTQSEVAAVLAGLTPDTALLGRLLYGTGMRLMEGPCPPIRAAARGAGISGHRHPHSAGAAGPLRREHDDDLHPRAEGGRRRHGQSAGCAFASLMCGLPQPARSAFMTGLRGQRAGAKVR